MDMTALQAPFDPALVKQRRGAFGQMLSYVEVVEYIKRLNEAFNGEWSFEVLEHAIHDNEVIVLGRLTAGGVVKTAFGGSRITTHSETGEHISLGDDLKSAASSALRKAASLLGLGISLYSDTPSEPSQPKASGNGGNGGNGSNGNNGNGRTHARTVQTRPNPSSSPSSNGNSARLTQKQLSAIWSLGRKLTMTADDIRERAVQLFKNQPEHLSRADASSLISEFSDELGGAPV
ncbi:MAG TPA: Rad52/Rad22 family DNA repair protein [Verrucomicrobiota bacterium]|nr:Rad52/Rad22 family DNA repair protein [Verrucomicrobiota bacterium]